VLATGVIVGVSLRGHHMLSADYTDYQKRTARHGFLASSVLLPKCFFCETEAKNLVFSLSKKFHAKTQRVQRRKV